MRGVIRIYTRKALFLPSKHGFRWDFDRQRQDFRKIFAKNLLKVPLILTTGPIL